MPICLTDPKAVHPKRSKVNKNNAKKPAHGLFIGWQVIQLDALPARLAALRQAQQRLHIHVDVVHVIATRCCASRHVAAHTQRWRGHSNVCRTVLSWRECYCQVVRHSGRIVVIVHWWGGSAWEGDRLRGWVQEEVEVEIERTAFALLNYYVPRSIRICLFIIKKADVD